MISLTVNGTRRTFDGDPSMPLLWFLRDELTLTGTKYGCGVASCGACTVHVDGEPVRACQRRMSSFEGRVVTTIEGLHPTAHIRRRSPGARSTCRSAGSASRVRSWGRRRSSRPRRNRPTPKSTTR